MTEEQEYTGMQPSHPAVQRLSRAVSFATVSAGIPESAPVPSVFGDFEDFLTSAFPGVHKQLVRERPGDPGLLYTWPGSNPDLKPIILAAHYDVVPARQQDGWQVDPFSGCVQNGAVWGRGTLDDKSSLMGLLEAVESLIANGVTPQRTIYLAFGGDEEVTGVRGAARIAEELSRRGVRAACLIDEGTAVVHDSISMVQRPIALIGTAEKGYVDITLTARGADGHASMPTRNTATGRLSAALLKLERNPFPPRMLTSVASFLQALAPAAPRLLRPILRRPRLFRPLLLHVLSGDSRTDAMIRTTQVPTMLKGSPAPNVLPAEVSAVINLRLLPGETIDGAHRRLSRLTAGSGVTATVRLPEGANNPVPESRIDSESFRALRATVIAQFPDAVPAPYLVTSTTDSKHYAGVVDNIYRFLPVRMGPQELSSIHGVNEHISIEAYSTMIEFYTQLVTALAGTPSSPKDTASSSPKDTV